MKDLNEVLYKPNPATCSEINTHKSTQYTSNVQASVCKYASSVPSVHVRTWHMGYMCSVEIALVLVLIQRVLITDMDYEFEGDKFISPLLSDHLQVVQNMPEHQVVETSLRCLLKARPIGWFRNIYGRGTTFYFILLYVLSHTWKKH